MNPAYLSDEWFDRFGQRVADAVVGDSDATAEGISFGYEISDLPPEHPAFVGSDDSIRYQIVIDGSTARIERNAAGPADVRFSMPFDVAVRVAAGSESGSRSFLNGQVRVGGDVELLIARADDLKALNGLADDGHESAGQRDA